SSYSRALVFLQSRSRLPTVALSSSYSRPFDLSPKGTPAQSPEGTPHTRNTSLSRSTTAISYLSKALHTLPKRCTPLQAVAHPCQGQDALARRPYTRITRGRECTSPLRMSPSSNEYAGCGRYVRFFETG